MGILFSTYTQNFVLISVECMSIIMLPMVHLNFWKHDTVVAVPCLEVIWLLHQGVHLPARHFITSGSIFILFFYFLALGQNNIVLLIIYLSFCWYFIKAIQLWSLILSILLSFLSFKKNICGQCPFSYAVPKQPTCGLLLLPSISHAL